MQTIYAAAISYGKDSIAMLHVIIDILKLPLDRIFTVDVWFDDETRAELPPMTAWKEEADKMIYERWGIRVDHLCAMRGGQRDSYTRYFGESRRNGKFIGNRVGFPMQRNPWCNKLKTEEVDIQGYFLSSLQARSRGEIQGFPISINRGNYCTRLKYIRFPDDKRELVYGRTQKDCPQSVFSDKPHSTRGEKINIVQYIGIAADEPKRIKKHKDKKDKSMPLVDAGWTEAMCYEWCKENNLLAPTYTTSMRDGCWFCHNQGVNQLRNLYHDYPDLWQKLLALDDDSPVTFHADGHTVHDFDRRFKWEDEGYKQSGNCFRWCETKEAQMNIFQFLEEET